MPQRGATPPFAHGRDGTGLSGRGCEADRTTVVADLLSGRDRHPLRVVAFDANDGWVRDVSAEVAHEVLIN